MFKKEESQLGILLYEIDRYHCLLYAVLEIHM